MNVKEHFPTAMAQPRGVIDKPLPINEVVALNLKHWLEASGLSQAAVAERAGVNQKTISNYLHPEQRAVGASGKPPSAKLSELDAIAKALGITVWQLTRQMTASERAMYEAIETAYLNLMVTANGVQAGKSTPAPAQLHTTDATGNYPPRYAVVSSTPAKTPILDAAAGKRGGEEIRGSHKNTRVQGKRNPGGDR